MNWLRWSLDSRIFLKFIPLFEVAQIISIWCNILDLIGKYVLHWVSICVIFSLGQSSAEDPSVWHNLQWGDPPWYAALISYVYKSLHSNLMWALNFWLSLVVVTPCSAGWGRPFSPLIFTFRYCILLLLAAEIRSCFSWYTVIFMRMFRLYSLLDDDSFWIDSKWSSI